MVPGSRHLQTFPFHVFFLATNEISFVLFLFSATSDTDNDRDAFTGMKIPRFHGKRGEDFILWRHRLRAHAESRVIGVLSNLLGHHLKLPKPLLVPLPTPLVCFRNE